MPAFEVHLLQTLNLLAVYSISPEVVHGNYGSFVIYSLQPAFWVVDFFVFLWFASFSAYDTFADPFKSYQQERLPN